MRIKTTLRYVFNASSGGGSVPVGTWINKGDHDASGGSFPSGVYNAFNTLKVTVGGLISDVYCGAGDILIAMQNAPTSDWDALTGWKKI